MISFLEDCNTNAIQCGTTVVICLYTLFVLLFALWCMMKTYRIGGGISFEQMPLAASFIQSTLQFVQNFFIEDIRLLLGSQFVQAISFIFVAMSFSLLYFRSQQQLDITTPTLDSYSRTLRIQRIIKITLLLSILAIIVTAIVVLSTLEKGDCKDWFSVIYYIPLSMSGFAAVLSMLFGAGLRRKIVKESQLMQPIKKKEVSKSLHRASTISSLINSDSQHSDDLKKQVNVILITYTLTIIAQIILNLIRSEYFNGNIGCRDDFTFLSLEDSTEIFLFFITVVEVTPCVVIPYVFYYIPFAEKHKILQNTKDLDISQDEVTSRQASEHLSEPFESDRKATIAGVHEIGIHDFKRGDYNAGSINNNDL